MKVGLGADHGGFELKQQIAELVAAEGHEFIDFGNKAYDPNDDYPDFAIPVARAVSRGEIERGILLCGSDVGASIAANKVVRVRAAVCLDRESARLGVEDDNLNILCLGGRSTGIQLAWDCTRSFLNARFSGARRYHRRSAMVARLEADWLPIVSIQTRVER